MSGITVDRFWLMRLAALLAIAALLIGCTTPSSPTAAQAVEKTQDVWNQVAVMPTAKIPASANPTIRTPSQVSAAEESYSEVKSLSLSGSEYSIRVKNPYAEQIYFYYSPLCIYSQLVTPLVDELESESGGKIEVHRFNVLEQEGYFFFDQMLRARNLPDSSRVVPIVEIKGTLLIGIQEISASMRELQSP